MGSCMDHIIRHTTCGIRPKYIQIHAQIHVHAHVHVHVSVRGVSDPFWGGIGTIPQHSGIVRLFEVVYKGSRQCITFLTYYLLTYW